MSNVKLIKPKNPYWTPKRLYSAIKIYAVISGLLCVFINAYSRIFIILYLAVFPLLCCIYMYFPNDFTLEEKSRRGQSHISLVNFFWSYIIVLIYLSFLQFNHSTFIKLLLYTAILSCILIIFFIKLAREYKSNKHILIWASIFLTILSLCLVSQMNYLFDFSRPEVKTAIAMDSDVNFPTNRTSHISIYEFLPTYKVTVKFEDGSIQNLYTALGIYSNIEENNTVNILTYKGFFGIPYQKIALSK